MKQWCALNVFLYSYKDKTVQLPYHFYDGNPIPGKTVFILRQVRQCVIHALDKASMGKSHSWLGWSRSLQWRHNGRDGVSNHQPHHCLLNRLFGRRSKKTPKLRVTGLCTGNSPVVNSPHKGPVTRKMFPFDDVIMWLAALSWLLYHGDVCVPTTHKALAFTGTALQWALDNSGCEVPPDPPTPTPPPHPPTHAYAFKSRIDSCHWYNSISSQLRCNIQISGDRMDIPSPKQYMLVDSKQGQLRLTSFNRDRISFCSHQNSNKVARCKHSLMAL